MGGEKTPKRAANGSHERQRDALLEFQAMPGTTGPRLLGRACRKAKRAIDASKLSDAVAEVETLNEARGELLKATAAQMMPGLIGGFTALVIPRDDEFRKQYPQWKRALLNLCRGRIAQ